MPVYEVGVVYKKNSQLFLAVSQSSLINCKGGVGVLVRPTTQYEVSRGVSVEDLCDRWGIDLDEFDRLISKHVMPKDMKLRSRPRGLRRTTEAEEDYWRKTRTGRIARPRL